MRFFLILFCSLCLRPTAYSQLTSDALLFGASNPTINARSMALGNALGALGGDLSTASFNPAGLAIYRRSEASLSIGGLFEQIQTDFLGSNTSDGMAQFSFGNLGLLVANKTSRTGTKWKYINVGFTINRLSNYAENFKFSGLTTGSRVQAFAANTQGYPIAQLDPYEGWVAYNSYLIDSVAPLTYAANGGLTDSAFTFKSQDITRKGGVTELGLSFAANYNHKLYIGATVGVDFLSYDEDRIYEESADSIDFQYLQFSENRNVRGTGINLKLGLIYRINKMLRFGLSIHTPTAYRLVDSYNTGLSAQIVYDSLLQQSDYSMEDQDPFVVQHNFYSPWVFSGSLGMLIFKRAFIGVDVQYLDYSWTEFTLLENDRTTSNLSFMDDLNQRVKSQYKAVLKVKVGAEVALGIARIRLGYQFESSPYQISIPGVSDVRHDISAGFGVRWKHFFLDLGYVHSIRDFDYVPYVSPTLVQQSTAEAQRGHFMVTFGASMFRS